MIEVDMTRSAKDINCLALPLCCIKTSSCWCCCNVRIGTRVACIFNMSLKVSGFFVLLTYIPFGQFLSLFLLTPDFLIFISTFTNDLKLAKLGYTFHTVCTKFILLIW